MTAGNAGDAAAAAELIADLTGEPQPGADVEVTDVEVTDVEVTDVEGADVEGAEVGVEVEGAAKVFGDCAYGSGALQSLLEERGIDSGCKTQAPAPLPGGLFTKDRFAIDLAADAVTCPNGVTAVIRRGKDGSGVASFAASCAGCPLRAYCTTAAEGRSVR